MKKMHTYYGKIGKEFAAIVNDPDAVEKFLSVRQMANYDGRAHLLGSAAECAQEYLTKGDRYFRHFCQTQGEEIRERLILGVTHAEEDFWRQNDKVAVFSNARVSPDKICAATEELRKRRDKFEEDKKVLRAFEKCLNRCLDICQG